MRVRAAVLREAGAPPVIEDAELDVPRAGEVRVRLVATGICHTDLLALDGALGMPLPCVLGHEGAGVVEAIADDVTALQPGDHVVLSFDSCGDCTTCRAGRPAYCEHFAQRNNSGRRADGSTTLGPVHGSFLGQSSFATHALATTRNAVRVPTDVPLAHLAPLGCGVLTGAGAVLEVLRPQPGDDLAVVGLGTVGLAAIMAAKLAGCTRIAGIDPDPARRALAVDLGATEVHAPGARPDRVGRSVDTVATQDALTTALRLLRSPGTCATVGFRGLRNPVTVDQGHLLYGRTLTGVIEGDADPQRLIPQLAQLHREGRFPVDRLITTFPFADLGRALAAARSGAAVKPVLLFG